MDYSKLKPLHGIIVLRLESQTVSTGGIHFVEEKRLDYAEVVAVGPGEWNREKKKAVFKEVGVKVGDTVVIGPGSGVMLETEIDGEKETLTYLSEMDIVAVIRK
ncbi:hypothetical protein LCGC14_2257810 [marine sediment metagenome]|uniref:10 kDa chaperonin n=1 Tax=marine sediment metagenome TaxID=412755 RepID=A0A0F9FVM9_9ZZZZ